MREERSFYYAHADTAPELQNYHRFYYAAGSLRNYGYSNGLVISFIHTGPTNSAGTPFPSNPGITNGNGSIAVGIIGGYNNIVNGTLLDTGGAGAGGGNVHTHMRFYQMTRGGRMGSAIDPRKVFCSDLGFR